MSIAASCDLGQRRALLLASLLFLAPLPLQAQMGGLLKRAAAKVARQSAEVTGVGSAPPSFDDTVLELTEARLTAVVAGMEAAATFTGEGGATRASLVARAAAANAQRDALIETHDAEWQRLQADERRIIQCTTGIVDSLGQVRNAELEKKRRALAASADPMNTRLMQEIMQGTMEMQRHVAAGDTAAAMAVQRAMQKKLGFDPASDSAYAVTRCGRVPATPSWRLQSDSLLTLANTLMRQAQALDEQAAAAGARTAGMTAQQFAVARERIVAYANANGAPSASWRYSATERRALLPRLQQLKALA
jgi:hypothetical protein